METIFILAEQIFYHLWAVSWQVTILIAVIWLVDRLSFRASSLFRYWLWMIVLLRLCIPISIELPTGIDTSFILNMGKKVDDFRYRNVPIYETGDTSPLFDLPLVRNRLKSSRAPDYDSMQKTTGIPLRKIIFFMWYAAFIVICTYIAARTIAMARRLKLCVPVERPEVMSMMGDISTQIGLKKPVGLYYMERDLGDIPAVIGIFNRRILIPRVIADEWPVDDLKPVLLHELAHIKRSDLMVNIIQILVQAIYFYHPFVRFANQKLWRYREEACDDLAVRLHDNRRKHYTLSMLNVLKTAVREPSLGFVGIGFTERKSFVHKRIKRILNTRYRTATRLSLISVLALIIFVIAGIAFSCKKSDPAGQHEVKFPKPPTMELWNTKVERPDSSIARLPHPNNIIVNSLRVTLSSDTLRFGLDYTYDYETGELRLIAEEAWTSEKDIIIRYDTYEPEDVNTIIFELTGEGQKKLHELLEQNQRLDEAVEKAYKEGYINRVIFIRAPSNAVFNEKSFMDKIRKSSNSAYESGIKYSKNHPLPKKQIVVELNKEGDFFIGGRKVSYESFEAYLTQEKHERYLRSQPSYSSYQSRCGYTS